MVKSAQDVAGDDAALALNRSAVWGVVQTEMGPCRVVIRSVFLQDAPKMGLAPYDHVVKALTSDRADCALDISVLPWRFLFAPSSSEVFASDQDEAVVVVAKMRVDGLSLL